mmetsp:Transcript_16248/g.35828  ORF Transcript_16248/g.35828 Transcript_16248/m.35828 type:complete len:211 (+) Transcript_16248:155-787(+)
MSTVARVPSTATGGAPQTARAVVTRAPSCPRLGVTLVAKFSLLGRGDTRTLAPPGKAGAVLGRALDAELSRLSTMSNSCASPTAKIAPNNPLSNRRSTTECRKFDRICRGEIPAPAAPSPRNRYAPHDNWSSPSSRNASRAIWVFLIAVCSQISAQNWSLNWAGLAANRAKGALRNSRTAAPKVGPCGTSSAEANRGMYSRAEQSPHNRR